MIKRVAVLAVLFVPSVNVSAGENLLVNGDFEQGLRGWSRFWSRTPGGRAGLDTGERHAGHSTWRIVDMAQYPNRVSARRPTA